MIDAYTVSMTSVRRKLRHAPGDVLRVIGDEFRYTPEGPPARYAHGQWFFDEEPWLTIRLESPVRIQFIREQELSEERGPFCPVYLFNGHLYCGTDENSLGDYDERSRLWKDSATGQEWTGLVIAEASG